MNSATSQFWQPADVDFVFQSYLIFEEKLSIILKSLPYETPENIKAWSPELVNLFIDICSTLDSTTRHIIAQGKDQDTQVDVLDGEGRIKSIKVKDLNVNDFEVNVWNGLFLLNKRVIFYGRALYPNCAFLPFEDYRNTEGWWTIYNKLKHSRINFRTKANLKHTLSALAALFMLLVSYRQEASFTKTMLFIGWLKSSIVPEYVHSQRIGEIPALGNGIGLWFDSNLFGASESHLLITSSDITLISPPFASQKFQRFVGRFNVI